jgi:hypothetical protein
MPSPWHDAVTQLFRDEPRLALTILHDCTGLDLPAGMPARLASPTFNDRPSTDFKADTVVMDGPPQDPVHGTIVEAQQVKDEGKLDQLARYAAALWLLIRRRVDVLVICPSQETADWYARPVRTMLPGYTFSARTVGPAQVPEITDPRRVASAPGLGAMSVAMHGHITGVAGAFLAGLALLGPEDGPAYYENAYSMSSAAIRHILEELVSATAWPVHSPFAKEHFGRGKAEGKAEGEAAAILLVLHARGVDVTPEDRARIISCTDLAQLDTWVTLAATITTTGEFFG